MFKQSSGEMQNTSIMKCYQTSTRMTKFFKTANSGGKAKAMVTLIQTYGRIVNGYHFF